MRKRQASAKGEGASSLTVGKVTWLQNARWFVGGTGEPEAQKEEPLRRVDALHVSKEVWQALLQSHSGLCPSRHQDRGKAEEKK